MTEQMVTANKFVEMYPKLASIYNKSYEDRWYEEDWFGLIDELVTLEEIPIDELDEFCSQLEELDKEQQGIALALTQTCVCWDKDSRDAFIEKIKNKKYDECRIEKVDSIINDLSWQMDGHSGVYAPLGFTLLKMDNKSKHFLIPFMRFDLLGEVYYLKYGWTFVEDGLYVKEKSTSEDECVDWL